MNTMPKVFIALSALFFLCPVLAYGQEVEAYFRFMPSSEAKAQPGKLEIIDAGSKYSYELKAFEKVPVKLSLDTRYIGIENTTAVELPAHLVGLATDIETTLPFFNIDKTYLRLGVSPSFYSDDWDFSSSSFRIPQRCLLIYIPNERWTFLAGLGVYPDYEFTVLPLFGFIYKPNSKLTFHMAPDKPNISYILNERVTLFAEATGSYNEFEVDKDNLKNVGLHYIELHTAAGLNYKINKFIRCSIQAGASFARSLKYRDSLGKVNLENGLFSELRVEIKI